MLHTLNVAQTGLKVSQTQVENVMNNIANENVAGYKKRVVNVSELDHVDARITGRGVFEDGVTRTTQVYMYQNLIVEQAKLSDIEELNTTLADIEAMFKETDTSGLSVELNSYFKSIENLRTTPHSEIYKNDIKNTANSLILELQKIYESIERKEDSMITHSKELVSKVNSILKEIGELSEKIQKNTYGNPNDLLDKRDALEKELAQFVDVEISRGELYQLKIGGATAVRFSTNVHEVKFVENYTPQQDIYIELDANGSPVINGTTNDLKSSLPVFEGNVNVAETQTIDMSGTLDSNSVNFLGTELATAGTSIADVVTAINDGVNNPNIIDTWNQNNPDKKIDTIVAAGTQITITYEDTEGDVPAIVNKTSNGLSFTGSLEDSTAANSGKGVVESLTYTINGIDSVTVAIGDIITDASGSAVDFDLGNATSGATLGEVTEDNIIQALVYQINNHSDYSDVVSAYNGKYETDEDGNILTTDNVDHSNYIAAGTNVAGLDDRYLFIEARHPGTEGSFVGELLINDGTAAGANTRSYQEKTDYYSKDGVNDIHLEIYEKEIDIKGGALRPMLDNLNSESENNLLNSYKEKLDLFARNLVNLTETYIENSDQSYVYGNTAVNENYNSDKAVSINLFDGASVKTLSFNQVSLNTMTQEKLDYLADLQWKDNIDFDGTGMYEQSFSEFYQTLRVSVADDREGVIFKEEAQMAVKEALQSNYDNIVKVDKDEELLELIKFQKSYEANAKIITVVDEMLETLLAIKR